MNDKYKDQFELINNSLWLLIKPYIKDDKPYKNIMSELFTTYMSLDQKKNKYSDEWWESTRALYDCPEKFKDNQNLCGFAAELADTFYELFKLKSRREVNISTYYKTISRPFLIEWGRLKHGDA